MSDNKKYYYIKLKENFFETDEMILLENMPDGYLYSNILLKLYLRSLKNDGKLMFNERIPYSPQMIATITRHQVGTVEKALSIFKELSLIDILDNGAIYMLDIQNYIGQSSSEADRKRQYRLNISNEKAILGQMSGQMSHQMSGQISDKNPPEIEKEKEINIKKESITNRNTKEISENIIPYERIKNYYNTILSALPTCTIISEKRKKAINACWKQFGERIFNAIDIASKSDFLTGRSGQWKASFDWIFITGNMLKILEGNYSNKNQAITNTEEIGGYDERFI